MATFIPVVGLFLQLKKTIVKKKNEGHDLDVSEHTEFRGHPTKCGLAQGPASTAVRHDKS